MNRFRRRNGGVDHLRLHPLSVAELSITDPDGLHRLRDLGGFPEPWLSGSTDEARRWSREYRTRLVEDDIRGLERVEDLGALERLVIRLTDLVGAPLSLASGCAPSVRDPSRSQHEGTRTHGG